MSVKTPMPKRVDENQAEIHARLREMGCSVQPISAVGDGCPDSLIGYRGFNFVLEIKNPKMKPSKRRLNEKQKKWHEGWKGQVAKVETLNDIIEILKQNGEKV